MSRHSARVLILLVSICFSFASNAAKPNVLLIAIDDMNDWASCLGGHPDGSTPNMERLAERGTLFTNAHCQAPICNPSRTSIMYGLRPSTSGVYMNAPFPSTVAHMQEKVTLPRWMEKNGYHTLTTGKIYHASRLPENDFQTVGPRPGQRLKDLDKRLRTDLPGGASGLWDFGAQTYDETLFQDYADATWAIEQLEKLGKQEDGKPFFLSIGFYRPHVPFYAPSRVLDEFPRDEIMLPWVKEDDWEDIPRIAKEVTANKAPPPHEWFVENDAWRDAVQAYLACIRWTDEQVGRLIDALDESPFAKNTIVVLYSDHGFHLGEKSRWTKFSLWERSTRVPFIIVAPGMRIGQRSESPVELLSIYPTLLELCGIPENPEVEGTSIQQLLRDASSSWKHHAVTTHGKDNHSVRSIQYRYIRYNDGSEELYDMVADPREWNNLVADGKSAKEKSIIKRLAKSLPDKNGQPARAMKQAKGKSKN